MEAVEHLRAHHLRVTKQRVAVLEALDQAGHLDAEDVRSRVLNQLDSVSVQAVYDVLNTLTESDLVRRIEPAGSPALYELRVGDNHHHLICRECGRVEDIDCKLGQAPCLNLPHEDQGFVIDEAEVTWWGLCPTCLNSSPAHNKGEK